MEEFFEERRIEITHGKTLQEAFSQKFHTFEKNPRFLRIREKVSGGRNISFIHPDGNLARSVAFPVGFVFLLRLPVFGKEKINHLAEELISLGARIPHEIIYEGEIIAVSRKEIVHLFADFVEFYVRLWEFEEVVDLIFDMDLVDPGRPPEFGLHVLDPVTAAPGSFTVCLRKEGPVDIVYAHWLKRPGDIDVIKAEEYLMNTLSRRRKELNGQTNRLN